MAIQHYALIDKEGCNPLEITFQQSATVMIANSNSSYTKKELSRCGQKSADAVRVELEEIYQNYADIYPNPKLLEEKRQRNTLLQAVRAASIVQQQEKINAKEKMKPRRGFFTFLFGTRNDEEIDENNKTNTDGDTNEEYGDDRIRYLDTPNEHDDGSLCGTLQSLDVSCIPPEVYNMARSHLTSTRTRRDNPNALRWGPRSRLMTQQQQQESNSSIAFIVVGLGEIAEFGGVPKKSSSSSSSRILHTSDRDHLLGYAERTQQFDLPAVRGTILSQNCFAISWGFLDGITVFYRRRILLSNDNKDETAVEGWEAVWWLGPSGPVLDNLTNDGQDLFHDNTEQPGSQLLKISDCVALHVEAPLMSGEDQSPLGETATVATLVISRLGGYIELVPLPIALWQGPILERSKARGQQREQRSHYATGQNIACPSDTLALKTFDYHLDVQAFEVYRTNVNSKTIWNNDKYPDGPPAEFLLVASGVSVDREYGETMTFWAVSTLFDSNEKLLATQTNNSHGNIDFQIHSRLLEAIWTSTGAPVSTFATPGIMSRWRTPRQMELKDAMCTKEPTKEHQDAYPSPNPLAPVTTLSTTAPIVSIKFSDCDRSSLVTSEARPFLSILDWNGGVQIFDCSVIVRLAAQNLTEHEYEQYRGTHNDSEQDQPEIAFNLVKCVVLRSQIGTALQKFVRIPKVTNLHWLQCTGGMLPSIAFILSRSRKLAVVTFDLPQLNLPGRREQEPLKPSIVSVPFPVSGAAIESLEDNCLSFVSLRRGSSKSSPQTTTHLFKYFVMEQLQPVAIVKTLARESKFEEAIQSASKLSKYDQNELAEVVVSCHRLLWKTKGAIDSLIATNDEFFILHEVESICESKKNEFGFSLDDLRILLKLAFQIASKHEDKEERARNVFVRLGTFELLCRYYKSQPSLKQFQNEFVELNIIDLSMELARRGDVRALSIVLFRHRFELHEKLLNILGSLPLALKPASFCHLLPVIRNENVADLFLDYTHQGISELPWSHMPQHVLEKYMVSLDIDRFDEMVVLEFNQQSNNGVDEWESSVTLVADWFVERAKQIQTFVGDIDDVVSFTEVGRKCTSRFIDKNTPNTETETSNVHGLHITWRTALSLKSMLLDQSVSINRDGMNTDDLMGMNLVELLDLVLDCGVQSSIVRYRFNEYIQPLVMEMSISSSSYNLDEALAVYCLKEAKKRGNLQVAGTKHALASTVAIAEMSKASLPKKNRLIKSNEILIRMVLNVTDEISKNLDMVETLMDDRKEIIESIWSLYETLPTRLATPESKNEINLQRFYDNLVGIDILSRWPGCNPFKFFNRLQSWRHDDDRMFEENNCDVVEICKSFCAIIEIASSQDQVALLQDLLSDVQSFNEVVFKGSVDLSTTLCECLIPTFLEQGYFGLVACYLGFDKIFVDKKRVLQNVIEYVDEAMYSEGDHKNRITNAIKCQDLLEPLLPEIQPLFQSNRRYLDASHFISTVLLNGATLTPLNPSDLKELTALDVVETILRDFPGCIGCRCSQWMNTDYALTANKLLRQAEASICATMEGHETELPDLPGGAVFHLATILGLQSSMSALAVKSRVIHYALQGGFYGAAAAIARTLLHEQDFGFSANMAVDTIKLGAIAGVVSIENYLDLCTKKELCETVLRRFDREACDGNSEFFNTILQVSSNLDYITSRFDQKIGTLSPERKERLLSRPIARLHIHTFHEYNRDMHCLFTDFGKQSSEGLVHDSLMDALSRFIFYWCIHDSIKAKSVVDLRYQADTQENLKLGCGLVLQIPSIVTAENSVHELQEISLTQAEIVAAEERFEASNNFMLPNPDVLKHLIDRGFTENAARKAVTMTGNTGQNEAMAWVVGHAIDPDLNNPLIMLKPLNSKLIDEVSIQVLQKSLIQLSDIIGNPSSRSIFLQNLTNTFQSDHDSFYFTRTSGTNTKTKFAALKMKNKQKVTSNPIGQKQKKSIVENGFKPSGGNRAIKENGTKKSASAELEQNVEVKQIAKQQRIPPPPPCPSALSHKTIDPVSKSMEIRPKDPATHGKSKMNRNDSTNGSATRTIAQKGIKAATNPTIDIEELKKRGIAALDKLKRGGSTSEIGSLTERTKIGEKKAAVGSEEPRTRGEGEHNDSASVIRALGRTGIATKTVVDREELRKRGQAALNKLRNTQKKPESRRRLIEDGRQLLKQSKTSVPLRSLVSDRVIPSARSSQNTRSRLSASSLSSKDTSPTHFPITGAVPTSQPPGSNQLNKKLRPIVPTITSPSANEVNIGKVVKIAINDGNPDDTGWDFDDFDSF